MREVPLKLEFTSWVTQPSSMVGYPTIGAQDLLLVEGLTVRPFANFHCRSAAIEWMAVWKARLAIEIRLPVGFQYAPIFPPIAAIDSELVSVRREACLFRRWQQAAKFHA